MPFPDPTRWAPAEQPTNAVPPQAVLDLMGGTFDANRYSWDPYTSRLTDRTTGGSYDYSGLIASQNPANLVTDLTAYNASGGQDGVIQLPLGSTPYFGFGDSASGYDAGLMPGSGTFVSTDPNEIADYRSHANDVVTRGALLTAAVPAAAGIYGALSGGAAAGGAGSAGATTAAGLPTGAGIAAAPLTGGTGAVAGGLLPGVASGAGGLTGVTAGGVGAAGAAANALGGGNGAANGITNALTGAERWLPYLTTGLNTLLGAQAANQASDAEVAAMREAIAEQRRQYDTTRADWEPWMSAGRDALGQLADPGNYFSASPDYDFRRSEGTRDIQNTFAASGSARSGNALRALTEFNSNLASGEFNNWRSGQLARAGLGTSGTSAVTNAGNSAASQTSNYLAGTGAARAAGLWGRNAAVADGLNSAVSNWLYRRRAS